MSAHFNKLTPAEAERLALLSEELGEAQQAIGKILRHGYESGWNGSNNRHDLEKELGDVGYAVALLTCAEDVDDAMMQAHFEDKSRNVRDFLHHQPKRLLSRVKP